MCVVVNGVVYVWYMCGSECCSFRATHADRTHSTPSLVDLDHVTYRTHGPTRAGSPEPIARTLYMHSHNCYLKKISFGSRTGSTYVHWGRSTCLSPNTLVYSGELVALDLFLKRLILCTTLYG